MDIDSGDILHYRRCWSDLDLDISDSSAEEFEPIDVFWKQLVVFPDEDDCSYFYTFDYSEEYPLVCWEVRHTDGTTIMYDINGEQIGQGIPTPSNGFSLSGYNDASWPDPWIKYRENADFWFAKWCSSSVSLSLPTPAIISSYVTNPDYKFFYELAHGSEYYFMANNDGSYYYSDNRSGTSYRNVKEDMNNRQSMKFAFIGSCHGMTSTDPGTFSYEFRKGQMKNTVTVGFDHMETCSGWEHEWYWQDNMFENMDRGLTVKESFDMATAQYPTIEPAVIFLGDENLTVFDLFADLEYDGELNWTKIKPETEITDNFKLFNVGEESSKLDWKIESYPSWGNWTFDPVEGINLAPEDGEIIVQVSIFAPDEKNAEFSGEIRVVNQNNPDDYEIIQVSLSTPKNKAINTPFLNFLENHPHLFPLLRQLLRL
jgi:hypothetical protein